MGGVAPLPLTYHICLPIDGHTGAIDLLLFAAGTLVATRTACAPVAALSSPRVWVHACSTYFVYYYIILFPLPSLSLSRSPSILSPPRCSPYSSPSFLSLSPFHLPLPLYLYPLSLFPSHPPSLSLSPLKKKTQNTYQNR